MNPEPLHVFFVLAKIVDRQKTRDLQTHPEDAEPDPRDGFYRFWNILDAVKMSAAGAIVVEPLPDDPLPARVRFTDVMQAADTAQMMSGTGRYQVAPLEGANFTITDAEWLHNVRGLTVMHSAFQEKKTAPANDESLKERFVTDGQHPKFDHNEFAKWLLNESGEHFITLTDNNQVYRYSEGVYVPYGEAYIKHLVQVVMGGYLMTEHNRNEVVAHVRALTSINRDEFDKDLDIINMRNGLYHVESGDFEQHTPEYLSLSKMDVIFDPDATCPVIDQFVKDVVEPHRVDAVYEIAGYAVLPKKRLKRGFIFVGEPDTGKSTMIGLICSFVGVTRICDVSPVVIGSDGHASYDFFGMLVNRVDDLGTTPIIETGVLKSIISSAPIRANQKYGKPFSFTPNVMILFGCNQVPMCADVRLRDKFDILTFKNVHSDRNINPCLPDELTTDGEMSGLFNKVMVAVKTAIKNKAFTGEYTLSDRQKDYEYRSNPLAQFIDELCDLSDQEASIEKPVFRKIYIEWSKDRQFSIATVGEQTTFLQNKGVILRKLGPVDDRVWSYVGMDIRQDVQVMSKMSKSCPNEKPMVFQEQKPDSRKSVPRPTPILRGGSKKNDKVERGCGLDIGHQRKNDSGMPNSDLDITGTQVGHGQMCGKCGCKLSDQTFQGPAGLGMICAACQAGLNQASRLATIAGEQLAMMIKSAIYKLGYVRGLYEFTPAQVLMEFPKDTGAKTEMIKAYLIEHESDLKIERIADGVWRQVTAWSTQTSHSTASNSRTSGILERRQGSRPIDCAIR